MSEQSAYTEAELEEMHQIMQWLPGDFHRREDTWEAQVLRMAEIINGARERQRTTTVNLDSLNQSLARMDTDGFSIRANLIDNKTVLGE